MISGDRMKSTISCVKLVLVANDVNLWKTVGIGRGHSGVDCMSPINCPENNPTKPVKNTAATAKKRALRNVANPNGEYARANTNDAATINRTNDNPIQRYTRVMISPRNIVTI
jgi:hypothetical protein